ncbi:hypothetical protein BDK51DRAFT_37727 [Blyttiomyces helicus]|uniref:Uncharacterized protein n=1 Tax=Blyttiomyces helicus TaxID=388810 RepID=A0A4P9WQ24_9FUNG|nr:hypothetical protein BDK51DRAFT_37727 [Blyttiomyces helicus]|eukprot:RKO93878.1 hypothetical protein BDK51DRAFT_37727 [Blyttiomyces helicus]
MSSLKKLKEWEARINKLDEEKINAADPELKAILSEIRSGKKETIPIGDCTKKHIEEILSLNTSRDILSLDTSRVSKGSLWWKLPEDVVKHEPSLWFKKAIRLVDKSWKKNSESTTRTHIDLILLAVLKHKKSEKIACWGEVRLTWTGGTKILTGYSDYVLGYGGGTTHEYMSTMLVCGEAKCYLAEMNIWQIVAYCGVIHKARKLAGRPNSTLVRIDNKSKVWTSLVVSEEDAPTWLRYILDCAKRSTPFTTPTTSNDDLRNNELINFKIVVERFRTNEWDESEDEQDEDQEELVEVEGSGPVLSVSVAHAIDDALVRGAVEVEERRRLMERSGQSHFLFPT